MIIIITVMANLAGKGFASEADIEKTPCAIYEGGSWWCTSKSEFKDTNKTAYCRGGLMKQLTMSYTKEGRVCFSSNEQVALPQCPSDEVVDKCKPRK